MLTLSIHPLLKSRGVMSSIKYLQQLGLPLNSARYIHANKLSNFNLATVEKLCTALNCTPNDLLIYTPSKDALPPQHALHTLSADRFRDEIKEGLQQLDAEEVALIKEQVRQLVEKKKDKGSGL